ncbi:serine hydrolase domain-containing protein [Amycolatopsis sp. cmx-11-51]|uniref:serine hydrolase domain-containing protein n=1 Tax=unclassified Amycolatopsis TaxID=2618356 RepID=UPI0039E523F7
MIKTAVRRVLDRAMAEGGIPGILVEIREGAGSRSDERKRSPEDRFRIGSITKTFTATVLLQLAAENKVRLDDPVGKWLPGLVEGNGHDGDEIPLRRLLDHTSGIANHTEDPEALSEYETYTPRQLVDIALRRPAAFKAGTDWAYSNTNYVLAGMIAERVTGRDLAAEIATRITVPLGLSGTRLPRAGDETLGEPHSRHHTKLFSPDPAAEIYDATELEPSPYWAAGGMVSTAGDLNRFFGALLGGRLLPPEQQRAMFTTIPTKNWLPATTYGLGVSSVTLPDGTELWGMGGALFGSWSYVYGSRDGGHLLAVNVNGDWTSGPWDDASGVFTDLLVAEFC